MPEIDKKQLAQDYGFALAFLNSNPELKKLFNQAVRETWDASRFVARLRDTKWFKTTSASVRQAETLKTTDPETYKQRVDQMYATVKNTYGNLLGRGPGYKRARALAESAFRHGWSEAELNDRIFSGVNFAQVMRRKDLGGEAAKNKQQIETLREQYGVALGDDWIAGQVGKILKGDGTLDGVANTVKRYAMREYSAFADAIEGGQTVAEIAEPYKQAQAELMEQNPADIGLRDWKIRQALVGKKDAKGRQEAMSLYDFADMVRRDPKWLKTDNAKEQMMSSAQGILRQFGLVEG